MAGVIVNNRMYLGDDVGLGIGVTLPDLNIVQVFFSPYYPLTQACLIYI